jgi:hypothetical protein
MSKKTIINKIIKEAKLDKTAQDAINQVNQSNTQDSKDYADKVFQELLNNLHITGLDD